MDALKESTILPSVYPFLFRTCYRLRTPVARALQGPGPVADARLRSPEDPCRFQLFRVFRCPGALNLQVYKPVRSLSNTNNLVLGARLIVIEYE